MDLFSALQSSSLSKDESYAIRTLAQLTPRQLSAIHAVTGSMPRAVRAELARYRNEAGGGFVAGRLIDVDPGVMSDEDYRTFCFAQVLQSRFSSRGLVDLVSLGGILSKFGPTDPTPTETDMVDRIKDIAWRLGQAVGLIAGTVKSLWELLSKQNPATQEGETFIRKLQVEAGLTRPEALTVVQQALQNMATPLPWKSWLNRWFFATNVNMAIFFFWLARELQTLVGVGLFTDTTPNTPEGDLLADAATTGRYASLIPLMQAGGPYDFESGGPYNLDAGMIHDIQQLEPAGGPEDGLTAEEVGFGFLKGLRGRRKGFGSMLAGLAKFAPLLGTVASVIPGGSLVAPLISAGIPALARSVQAAEAKSARPEAAVDQAVQALE